MSGLVKHCWPKAWCDAAVAAGFAAYDSATNSWLFFGGDEERRRFEQFAEAVAKHARESAPSGDER